MKSWLLVILLAGFTLVQADPPVLFESDDGDTSGIADCDANNTLSCQRVKVNFDALLSMDQLTFPNSSVMELHSKEPGAEQGSVFLSFLNMVTYSTASLTYKKDNETETLIGQLTVNLDLTFAVAPCGTNCHVLVQKASLPQVQDDSGILELMNRQFNSHLPMDAELERLVNKSLENPTRMAPVDVFMYYTTEFKERFGSNTQAVIYNKVNEMNRALKNVDVYMYIRAFCFEEVFIPSNAKGFAILDFLKFFKGSAAALLGSADLAFLWTVRNHEHDFMEGHFFSGLAGTINYPRNRLGNQPFAWGNIDSPHILGHELGHLFGLRHERPRSSLDFPDEDYGHGYHVQGSNFHTIMAYSNDFYRFPLNAYSTPRMFLNGVLPIGTPKEDSARLLQEIRFAIAYIGRQNQECGKPFECRDENDLCASWAARGWCTQGKTYLLRQRCQLSCGLC